MKNPEDEALLLLAEGFLGEKRFREAMDILDDLDNRYPHNGRVLRLRRQCAAAMKRRENTRRIAEALTSTDMHTPQKRGPAKIVETTQHKSQRPLKPFSEGGSPRLVRGRLPENPPVLLDIGEPGNQSHRHMRSVREWLRSGAGKRVGVTMAAVYLIGLALIVWHSFFGAGTKKTFSGIEFVRIPSKIHSPQDRGPNGRTTGDSVAISSAFFLQKYEVTQDLWDYVMGESGQDEDSEQDEGEESGFLLRFFTEADDTVYRRRKDVKPITNVSWEECQAFIRALELKDLGTFRLPTEAEWEFACRAETKTTYDFGNDKSRLREYAWYAENSNGTLHPVGRKKPNRWNLFDMYGNAGEWCADWNGVDRNEFDFKSTGIKTSSLRSIRGGNYSSSAESLGLKARSPGEIETRYPTVGFRLCRDRGEVPARPFHYLTFPEDRSLGTLWLGNIGLGPAKGMVKALREDRIRLVISGEGIANLAPLQELEDDALYEVVIRNLQHVDDQLAHLSHLTNLARLNLEGSDVTVQGLGHLNTLENLEVLDLEGTNVSGWALFYLKNMPKLRILVLNRLDVADEHVQFLADYKTLERLELVDTQVTQEALKALQLALPQCLISPPPQR